MKTKFSAGCPRATLTQLCNQRNFSDRKNINFTPHVTCIVKVKNVLVMKRMRAPNFALR